MSCKLYKEQDSFEKYLMEGLSGPEKVDFETHLQQCAVCRQELDTQRLLIAGLRTSGREQMKQEIREQVRQMSHPRVNWIRIARIAAVLFLFIVTPSVYFLIREQQTANESHKPAAVEMQVPTPPAVRDEYAQVPRKEDGAGSPSKKAERRILELRSIPSKPVLPKEPASGLNLDEAAEREAFLKTAEIADDDAKEDAIGAEALTYTEASRSVMKFFSTGRSLFRAQQISSDSLVFSTNGDTILIRIHSDIETKDKETGVLPANFPVKVVKADSSGMEMIWFISDFRLQSQIQLSALQQASDKMMRVILPQGRVYGIDLKTDSTRAVLE